jgi:hypothetical protein
MPPRTREERLFGAACLKVQLERLGGKAGSMNIYRGALDDLQVTDEEVDAYLLEARPSVEAALARRGGTKDREDA